ncbi:hypothetical protein L4D06_06815 [Enterovibrio makurazakiensis]|uniref:hypothetical protein n=1 Tax=Enterovibrio makurazakiensis TaxID=2910232 RepID=UPI003D193DDE
MNRIVLTLLASIVLVGCASKTIRIVDGGGKPIEGALVISEQLPYIFQSWKLGVYVTDEKGEAVVVNDRGQIFRSGYFPVIEASELTDGILWEAPSFFSKRTPIYPIQRDEKILVNTSTYNTVNPIDSGVFFIPVSVCTSKFVSYNIDNSRIRVRSNDADIILSERFYFIGAEELNKVSEAERENNISFYCSEPDGLYKVGISVSEKVWRKGVPDHKITIFSAKVPSTEIYLQPEVKCANAENVRMITFGKYRDKKPDLYLSAGVADKLRAMRRQIPCSNENTDKILNYLVRIIKIG